MKKPAKTSSTNHTIQEIPKSIPKSTKSTTTKDGSSKNAKLDNNVTRSHSTNQITNRDVSWKVQEQQGILSSLERDNRSLLNEVSRLQHILESTKQQTIRKTSKESLKTNHLEIEIQSVRQENAILKAKLKEEERINDSVKKENQQLKNQSVDPDKRVSLEVANLRKQIDDLSHHNEV